MKNILIITVLSLISIALAGLNHKLGRICSALDRLACSTERIAEVELPVLSAAVVEAEDYQSFDICNPN